MENKNLPSTLTVNTTTNTVTENVTIYKPIFILFAEYLGYESPVIQWAEDLCTNKKCEPFKIKFMKVEAEYILEKMLKEFSISEIKQYYDDFYPLALRRYDENLEKLLNENNEDLPF